MNEFKTYHPIVNFIYFVAVIGFSVFFMHPLCLAISLFSSFSYSVILKGKKIIKTNLLYMLPMLVLMAVMNSLFNHHGATIITYLPDGNPLTFESIIYGIASALMIISVICHFSSYNEIMTSDKFIYLFGRIIPTLSLILSMTLSFVPKFTRQIKVVINAQKCMGRDISNGNIFKRAKIGISILSIMVTWALENTIETADSMKSRGYGLCKRTSYTNYRFEKRDKVALVYVILLTLCTLSGYFSGAMSFSYYPALETQTFSILSLSFFVSYFLLCTYPIIIEFLEVRKWKAIKSRT